jgi:hypothetical protein
MFGIRTGLRPIQSEMFGIRTGLRLIQSEMFGIRTGLRLIQSESEIKKRLSLRHTASRQGQKIFCPYVIPRRNVQRG